MFMVEKYKIYFSINQKKKKSCKKPAANVKKIENNCKYS